jgi:hypothetical protein
MKYAGKVYALIKKRTDGNSIFYAESIVMCHLRKEPLPEYALTTTDLSHLQNTFHICLEIVSNSVGIEDRYKQIQSYNDELSQLCRFISDIECGVLARSLEEEYAGRVLVHQR